MNARSLLEPLPPVLRDRVGDGKPNLAADVMWVQAALHALGRYNPQREVLPFINHNLLRAIREYQRDCGLKSDGQMTPAGETEKTMSVELSRILSKGVAL